MRFVSESEIIRIGSYCESLSACAIAASSALWFDCCVPAICRLLFFSLPSACQIPRPLEPFSIPFSVADPSVYISIVSSRLMPRCMAVILGAIS